MKGILPYWPVFAAVFAIVSAGATAQFQIQLNKMEIEDLSESVDELEELVEELQYWVDG